MGDENKIRDAADAVKGVVEAVPVYQDVLQPAAQEVGKGLQTVAKLVHVALAPVAMVVWGYEQIRDYLQETLTEKLKKVLPEQIVPPKMTIAGPIVEQLRFAADEPSLRELYTNLLATSMDANTAQNAHPAFVEIIAQLTPDEAHLINYLANKPTIDYVRLNSGTVSISYPWNYKGEKSSKYFDYNTYFNLAKESGCIYPELIFCYSDNLQRLMLWREEYSANTPSSKTLEFQVEWDAAREAAQYIVENETGGIPQISRQPDRILRFTDFGLQFCKACVQSHKVDA